MIDDGDFDRVLSTIPELDNGCGQLLIRHIAIADVIFQLVLRHLQKRSATQKC